MKTRTTIISIVLLIGISNLFSGVIVLLTGGLFQTYSYETLNSEFQFETMSTKGRDIEMMEGQFKTFLKANPKVHNKRLFRTFKRNPLRFWLWYDYMTHKRYQYPYKKP